jgi:hypothetical protein
MSDPGKVLGALLGGSLLGWAAPSLILYAFFQLQFSLSTHPVAYQIMAMALTIILPSLPTSIIATTTLGLAWHTIASKRGWRIKKYYWFPGLLIGAAVGAAMSFPFVADVGFDSGWWAWACIGTLYAGAIGGFTGLFAWLIRRPDRDSPNPATSAP